MHLKDMTIEELEKVYCLECENHSTLDWNACPNYMKNNIAICADCCDCGECN